MNRLNAATPAFYINTQEFDSANNISTNLFCVNPESFLVQKTVVQKANYFHEVYLSVEVVICRQQQILNLANQRSLFMTVRNIFETLRAVGSGIRLPKYPCALFNVRSQIASCFGVL